MQINPKELIRGRAGADRVAPLPLAGSRAQRLQRVQIGLFGLGAMILLVALADIVITRARQTDANAVPEAAPTVVASESPAPRDPLADAGVVPDLPATPEAQPTSPAPQESGDANPVPALD